MYPMAFPVLAYYNWVLEALSDWLSDDFILNPLRRTFPKPLNHSLIDNFLNGSFSGTKLSRIKIDSRNGSRARWPVRAQSRQYISPRRASVDGLFRSKSLSSARPCSGTVQLEPAQPGMVLNSYSYWPWYFQPSARPKGGSPVSVGKYWSRRQH